MTNPNNAIGTNGAFDGRTSPNALNDITAAYTAGIVSGWTCAPKSGMTVTLGGSATVRDVALAEDNAGNKLTINNRSGAGVDVTLDAAPSTNNRIDAIVAYVDSPSTGDGVTTDNPTACGIIAVKGTVAANPVEPTDAQIRSAITTDGATGGTAYYVVLATIRVGTNVSTIGSGVITQGRASAISANAIANGSIAFNKLNTTNTSFFAQVTSSTPIANTATKVLEIASVPAGKYLVVAQLEIRGTASNNTIEGNGYIYENGVEVIGQFGSIYSGVNRLGISLATTINHTTAGAIALYARGGAGSNWHSDGRTTLNIVRIG